MIHIDAENNAHLQNYFMQCHFLKLGNQANQNKGETNKKQELFCKLVAQQYQSNNVLDKKVKIRALSTDKSTKKKTL